MFLLSSGLSRFIRRDFLYLFTYLLTRVSYPCNFHDILSIVDSSSLLFENASDERWKQKLILLK